MPRSITAELERTLEMASRFLDDMRHEIERAVAEGNTTGPRLRSVHEKAGHATPEYRNIGIPVPEEVAGAPPEILSRTIARYIATKAPQRLLLAIDATLDHGDGAPHPVLIAEARDIAGTRLFWMQPYHVDCQTVQWDEPLAGGWQDPGEEELILDEGFRGEAAKRERTDKKKQGRT